MDKAGVVTAAQAQNTNPEDGEMPSADPPAGSPPIGWASGLHRRPRALAGVMRSAQRVAVTAAGAPNTTDRNSWGGVTMSFYRVDSSTWAAQFNVDVNLNYRLDLYTSTVDQYSGCQYTIWDVTYGVLWLKTYNGAPYLYFSCTSGEQTIWDTCFGHSGTSPYAISHAWFITALNAAGDDWMFDNNNYSGAFNHMEFRSGPLGAAAVQAAASRAVEQLSKLPEEIWVDNTWHVPIPMGITRAAQVDTGPEMGADQPPGRARRAK